MKIATFLVFPRCSAVVLATVLGLTLSPAMMAANRKPLADAGSDVTAALGTSIHLSGASSSDEDGVISQYRWRQRSGPRVALQGTQTPDLSFVTPTFLKRNKSTDLMVFVLTVVDDKKARATDSIAVSVAKKPVCPGSRMLINGICSEPPVCVPPQILRGVTCYTPLPVCVPPEVLRGGVCMDLTPQCVLPQVLVNNVCITPPPICTWPETLQNGVCAVPGAGRNLNDTGATTCSDADRGGFICPMDSIPGQDAEFGRDLIANEGSDGDAGFSFTKIDEAGADLPASAETWSCVRDNVTGLEWEIKTTDGSFRDQSRRFTHFSETYDPNGLRGGHEDASGYVTELNAQGLCGANDWRLPDAAELQGLVNYGVGHPGPVIDASYFPDTLSDAYWSGTPYAKSIRSAWVVYFDDGRVFDDARRTAFPVRLVRTANRAFR